MYYKKFIYNGSQTLVTGCLTGFCLSLQKAKNTKKIFLAVKL